jgi:hypothetical protein
MDTPSFHNSKAVLPQALAETILCLWSSLPPKKYFSLIFDPAALILHGPFTVHRFPTL